MYKYDEFGNSTPIKRDDCERSFTTMKHRNMYNLKYKETLGDNCNIALAERFRYEYEDEIRVFLKKEWDGRYLRRKIVKEEIFDLSMLIVWEWDDIGSVEKLAQKIKENLKRFGSILDKKNYVKLAKHIVDFHVEDDRRRRLNQYNKNKGGTDASSHN